WGARSISYHPVMIKESGSQNDTLVVPALDWPENKILEVGLGKIPFNVGPHKRRSVKPGQSSKPVHIGRRVRGLVFLQTLEAEGSGYESKGVKALERWFRNNYNSSYSINVAFYEI